jgi:hypothetical protein
VGISEKKVQKKQAPETETHYHHALLSEAFRNPHPALFQNIACLYTQLSFDVLPKHASNLQSQMHCAAFLVDKCNDPFPLTIHIFLIFDLRSSLDSRLFIFGEDNRKLTGVW